MRRVLPIAFAAAAFALSCKPTTAADSDSGETVPCSTDLDCITALGAGNCTDGVCVLCTSNAECPTGETCSANGTCGVANGGTGGSTSAGSSGGGSSTGGTTPGQCTSSCDCLPDGGSEIKGPACVSGLCAPLPKLPDGGPTCARTNDCVCGDICAGTSCVTQCTATSCPSTKPVCYPAGCGPCQNSTQCPAGQSCLAGSGACTAATDGGCSATHCCNNGDCPGSAPACDTTTGVCGPCTSSIYCSTGYTCDTTTGVCVSSTDSGSNCGPNGCASGLSCVNNACVAETCNPSCPPPATCGANNNCTCPANCGGICATGTTCDMTTCQCGTGSGGTIGGASGGLSGGSIGGSSGAIPTTCTTSPCGTCSSGTCTCIDGSACSSSDLFCLLGIGICE